MPMCHDYLTNHGLASVMQHTLEKVPTTCMRIVPPHPPEPKDNLTLFLDSLGNSLATRMPATPVVHPTVAPPVTPIVQPPAVAPLPSISAFGARPVPRPPSLVFGGGGTSCICSCRHGNRCVSFLIFSASTSWFQNAANKRPCDLHFVCSCCSIHTKGVHFWH